MNKRKLDVFLESDLTKLRDDVALLGGNIALLGGNNVAEETDCSDEEKSDSEDVFDHLRKSRKQYKKEIKDEAVRLSKSLGVEYVAEKSLIPIANIKRWIKYGTIKKKKTGRPVTDPELDQQLKDFIMKERSEKKFLSTKRFLAHSKKQAKLKSSKLKISWGWYRKFLKRHKLSMRKKTTKKIKACEGNEVIKNFIQTFNKLLNSGIYLELL